MNFFASNFNIVHQKNFKSYAYRVKNSTFFGCSLRFLLLPNHATHIHLTNNSLGVSAVVHTN